MRLIIGFCLLPLTLWANEVDVSQAGVLVAEQDVRAEGVLRQAMESLVSKNTGLSVSYLENNNLVTDDFSEVILRHYFEQNIDRAGRLPYWLRLVVDEAKLYEKLAEHELPLWPKRRDSIYIWMVGENAEGVLQHEPEGSEAHYWLSQWLANKGVPATFHQVSEDDLLDFAPEDVKNLNPDLVDYVHQVQLQPRLMLVYVKNTGRGYSYRLGLAVEDQDLIIKNRQFVEISKGFSYLSDFIQSHFAANQQIFANELADRTVVIRVNNIHNPDAMLTVLNYFDEQSLVKNWQVLSFKNSQMELRMDISVLPETWARFVDQESVLAHLPLGNQQRLIFSYQGL